MSNPLSKVKYSIAILSLGLTNTLSAEFYVIPVVKNSLNSSCIIHNGLTYCEMTSSTTPRTWLDRNIGAYRTCVSFDDNYCYGDYFQWGRDADGHEHHSDTDDTRYSTTTANTDYFIETSSTPYDWTTADTSGSLREYNWNPCPTGYRIPSKTELENENINNLADAFNKLKLPTSGNRSRDNGNFNQLHNTGSIWASTPYSTEHAYRVYFNLTTAAVGLTSRTNGLPVRCIKE